MQGRNDMTDRMDFPVVRPLAAYADALREVRPSPALDARIAALIRQASAPPGSSRGQRRQLIAGVAAGSAALLVATFVFWAVSGERGSPPTSQPSAVAAVAESLHPDGDAPRGVDAGFDTGFNVLPTGQYSLWPTEASVLRVRARLGATATLAPDGAVTDERRFWVDVRIANDGSMRIVRVVPSDGDWEGENSE